MPPPVPQTDPGPFLSGLEWLEGLGEVPLNLLRGRAGAAGRKLVDTVSSIPDAAIPGNWIPEVSLPEDDVTASEVAGVDRGAHPGIAKAVDIIGGTAVNPASWLGLRGGAVKYGLPLTEGMEIPGSRAAIEATKRGATSVYGKVPEPIRHHLAKGAEQVRRSANWLNIPPEDDAWMRQAKGLGNQASRAGMARTEEIYKDLSVAEQEAVGEIAHQINRGGKTDRKEWRVLDDMESYLANRSDIDANKVRTAVAQRQELMDLFANEGKDANVYDLVPAARTKNYINRSFENEFFSESAAGSARKMETPEQLLDYLKTTPDVNLEFNALNADAGRAAKQGRMVEKAMVGKKLYERSGGTGTFMLSDSGHRTQVTNTLKEMAKTAPDLAYKLDSAWNGMPARGEGIAGLLHKANKVFKGAATYGVILPRISFNSRNRISAVWQALSNDVARGTIGANAKRALSDLLGAFDDGYVRLTGGNARLTGSPLTKQLDVIEQAFKQSGGSTKKVREFLGKQEDGALLQEALDNGVLNNFIDSEELLRRMARTPKGRRAMDIMEWPAEIAQGLEQRMRLGTFLDLRKADKAGKTIAKDGADAAKTIRDTYLDYDVAGPANRTLRDFVPFASFLTQNVKQQGKFIARHPVAAVASAQLFGDDEGLPKYPWLEQQMSVPTGLDEKGNAQYLSGLGLPIEGLTAIPGFDSRDFYRDVVGSLQPALKSAFSFAADRDTLTGNKFGQYDKIFGESAGALGRGYNVLKGTGLIQPVTSAIGQAENIMDARKAPLEVAAQALTGARFTSVDPDLAERQRLEQYLESRPEIRSSPTYYQTDEDPELKAVMQELRAAKDRLKSKRKAEASL